MKINKSKPFFFSLRTKYYQNLKLVEFNDINPDYYWVKRVFDRNGNRIWFEQSTGYWCRYEYNDKNEIIYAEDSKGAKIDRR